jgi:hypothetical protein
MTRFTRRTYIRRYLETPIEFRDHGREKGHEALMFDCCKGGLHFISDRYMAPGSAIIITPCEALQDYDHCRTAHGLPARVIWCRRCSADPRRGFRCGVQFRPNEPTEHRNPPAP